MNQELRQVAPGVYATQRAMLQAEVADAVVFDVDGVIINVHQSYPYVICEASEVYLREIGFTGEKPPVSAHETTFFKAAGGFNSDWNLAQGVVLCYLVKSLATGSTDIDALQASAPDLETAARAAGDYGGGLDGLIQALKTLTEIRDWPAIEAKWDVARITRLCQEHYAGAESDVVFGITNPSITGPGMMRNETAMLSAEALQTAGLRYGIYTGRNYGETQKALELAGLTGMFPRPAMITETEHLKKPNPEGLFRIAAHLKPRLMIFCGDNLDDWQTVSRYEAERGLDQTPCLFCGVLDGSPGPLSYGLFFDRGATLMAKRAEDLLTWLIERRKVPRIS